MISELNSALFHLDPSCEREQWFRILAAFQAGGGDRDTAQAWSEQADNFTRSGFASTWASIKPGGIGGGTLFYLARQQGWTPKHMAQPLSIPKVRHPVSNGPAPSYQKAKGFWNSAKWEGVESHPYAKNKGITHGFGAKRGMLNLGGRGGPADCIVVPMRDWADRVVGVETILASGKKYSWGNKGFTLLGHPERAEQIHAVEGWASAWGISQMFPQSFAAIVTFGKSERRLEEIVAEASDRFDGRIVIHAESGKRDPWDFWSEGRSDEYREMVLGAAA